MFGAHISYFMRYLFTKELLPLLVAAKELGQPAHVMTVLGAGPSQRSRGGVTGVDHNDGPVAHFAALHPILAFTHISPDQVLTAGGSHISLGWLFAPLAWLMGYIKRAISLTQVERTKYMLYALLDPERGLFIRGDHGDVISSHVFSPDHKVVEVDVASPAANKFGFLNGVPMKGYDGSDAAVVGLVAYTEQVLAGIL
ncbi:hypothetical protein K438DRAFT_1772277 [Mycena galopus ATCC 62051]|nr:hypothetical protein K438DRAFT_1772277 [Mycena galopus ATCC 62051]